MDGGLLKRCFGSDKTGQIKKTLSDLSFDSGKACHAVVLTTMGHGEENLSGADS